MDWTAVALSESIFIWDPKIWSHNDLSPKRFASSSMVLMCMKTSVLLNCQLGKVILKAAPQPQQHNSGDCEWCISNFYYWMTLEYCFSIKLYHVCHVNLSLFVKILFIKFQCLYFKAFQVMILELPRLFVAWRLLVNLLNTFKTSLMEADSFSNNSWQKPKVFLFSVVNFIFIATEVIIKAPGILFFLDGIKTHFSEWSTKPKLTKSLTHFHT